MNSGELRENLCGLVEIPPLGSVLDAGCGKGADLRRLGCRFGPDAQFVGADTSRAALEDARAATEGDTRFSFLNADLSQPWPFDTHLFDCVFSNNVLECVPDKPAFLAETARVLRPGGQVVCGHWDHDTHLFDGGADKALVRRLVSAQSDWQQDWMADADGWMGRRLWGTFGASKLFTGRIETLTLTETEFVPGCYGYGQMQTFGAMARRHLVPEEECLRLLQEVEAQAERDEYFYSVTLFIYVGIKL